MTEMNRRENPVPVRLACTVLVCACAFTVFVGCSDDDPAAPAARGTIAIDKQPDLDTGGWILTRPGGDFLVGQGDTTLTDMVTGTYDLSWLPAPEYVTPDPFSGKLSADATLVLTGIYVWDDPNRAVIVIDVEPDAAEATWCLVREGQTGGIVGRGDDLIENQPPGDYRVEWRDVLGYVTPDTVTMTVVSPETTTFTGLYEIDPAVYPRPSIGWTYDNPLPEGFAQRIRGGASDDQDVWLPPDSFVWTSSLDGRLATGVDHITTDLLSVGEHVIELAVTDSDGFSATALDTVTIVAVPAVPPVVFIDRPDWGDYDTARSAGSSPLLGWDGSDAGAGSGHPAYVRFRFGPAELPGGDYAVTRTEAESLLGDFTESSAPEWSSWIPWDTDAGRRQIEFPNLQAQDPDMTVIQYLFAIQAWSETGAIGTAFTYAENVAHFNALEP
jgi:hypothetical protein